MITELTLIATAHYDKKGSQRLEKLLTILQPDIITVEFNPLAVYTIESRTKDRKRPEYLFEVQDFANEVGGCREGVMYLLDLEGYEYLTAKSYAQAHRIQVVLADPLVVEYTQRSTRFQNDLKSSYKMKARELSALNEESYSWNWKCPEEDIPIMQQRDAAMEQVIRAQSGRITHISGLMHLFAGNYDNLFKRLGDLSPRRIKLNAVDRNVKPT